jgi:hypothetical protein
VVRKLADHKVDRSISSAQAVLDSTNSSSKHNRRPRGRSVRKDNWLSEGLGRYPVAWVLLILPIFLFLIVQWLRRSSHTKRESVKRPADLQRENAANSSTRGINLFSLSRGHVGGSWQYKSIKSGRSNIATKPIVIGSVFLVCFMTYMLVGSTRSVDTSAAGENYIHTNDAIFEDAISPRNQEIRHEEPGINDLSRDHPSILEASADEGTDVTETILSPSFDDRGVTTDRTELEGYPYSTSAFVPLFYNPAGCKEPSNALGMVTQDKWTLSMRTISMLEYAVELFGGEFDPIEFRIVRNTTILGRLVFELHQKGGAINISLLQPGMHLIPYNEIDHLVIALRVAGFAAWFRDAQKLEDIYIQAIPIGARELSDVEVEQVMGDYGYFKGFNGLGGAELLLDPHGGPIICQWMIEKEHVQANVEPSWVRVGAPVNGWQMKLKEVAEALITTTQEESQELANKIGFLGGTHEDPSNMCGPLTAAILRDANLLPTAVGPLQDPKNFWYANPRMNGRPWNLFPMDEYDLIVHNVSISNFDFSEWPLCTGDVVYTYAGRGEYSHIFVVTEIDEIGRAYTVTNQVQSDSGYLVDRVLLYDPTDPTIGAFKNTWTNDFMLGRTGLGGFEVLRRKGVCLPAGSILEYTVLPGDTLTILADMFRTTIPAILVESNLPQGTTEISIGQILDIPVDTIGDLGEAAQ